MDLHVLQQQAVVRRVQLARKSFFNLNILMLGRFSDLKWVVEKSARRRTNTHAHTMKRARDREKEGEGALASVWFIFHFRHLFTAKQ